MNAAHLNKDKSPPVGARFVYLLWHTNEETNDEKLLGVYDSEATAQAAIENTYKSLPGFRDLPEGFQISKYEMNKQEWTSGYVSDDLDD